MVEAIVAPEGLLPKHDASSQAAWALLTEGVTAARIEAHRLRHLLSRAEQLVEKSSHKEHLYQVAGDIILGMPQRLTALEQNLDKTSLALSKMGESFLESRLPLSDKTEVEEAVESAFGGGRTRTSGAVGRVATRWLQSTIENADEILDVRLEGKPVREHIDEFLRGVITSGQRINKIYEAAQKTVQGYYSGKPVDRSQVLKWMVAYLAKSSAWGNDAMTPLLARVIVNGDFVY